MGLNQHFSFFKVSSINRVLRNLFSEAQRRMGQCVDSLSTSTIQNHNPPAVVNFSQSQFTPTTHSNLRLPTYAENLEMLYSGCYGSPVNSKFYPQSVVGDMKPLMHDRLNSFLYPAWTSWYANTLGTGTPPSPDVFVKPPHYPPHQHQTLSRYVPQPAEKTNKRASDVELPYPNKKFALPADEQGTTNRSRQPYGFQARHFPSELSAYICLFEVF